jgi:hypothetical protein
MSTEAATPLRRHLRFHEAETYGGRSRRSFYCSAQNYTALGYGDVVLSQRWRLLGPLEAINGLLLFGLSTAVMFAVLSRLITNRRRHRHRPPLGPAGADDAT